MKSEKISDEIKSVFDEFGCEEKYPVGRGFISRRFFLFGGSRATALRVASSHHAKCKISLYRCMVFLFRLLLFKYLYVII